MNNKAYFKPIEDYFENLTKQSSHLGSFVPMSDGAMDDVLSNDPVYPLVCLIDYEGKLNENDQRTIAARTLRFAILYKVDTADKPQQRQRVNDAEHIGLNILAKIERDSCSGDVSWLKKAFKKETVHFIRAEYEYYAGLQGAEFAFDLNIKNPLHYDSEFWT